MEMKGKGPGGGLEHGDLRMPEMTDSSLRRRSRARVFLHLTGIGIGLFLLLIGLGLGLTRSHWDRLALIPIIVGAALLLGWVTINHDFLVRMMKNRRVMVGANAVFMGLLAAVLLIMANFVAWRHYLKWDATVAGRFTLSQKTMQVLDNLEDDITVIVMEMKTYRTGHEETVARLRELLDLYKEKSPRITATFLQPDVDPTGTRLAAEKHQIGLTTVDLNNVYVISGEKRKVVRLSDMIDYERDPNNPMRTRPRPDTFRGEQHITSAVIEVTSRVQPKVYFLTGHGEADTVDPGPGGMMQLASTLKRDNILVETMAGIPGAGVPSDCEALIVLGPKARLDEREIERLRRYLDRGGRLLLAQDVGVLSGLESLVATYGVRFGNDAVIAEQARAGSAATFGAVEYSDHPISASLRGYATVWNLARTVGVVPDPSMGYSAMELVRTSPGAYAETDLATLFAQNSSTRNPSEDKGGPLSVAAASEARPAPVAEGQAPPKGARVVAFGDVEAFSNAILPLPYKNVDLFRNAVNWLLERQELIALEERPQTQHILVVDDAARAAVFYILVIGLPVLVLLVGGFVWAVRSYGSRQK